LLLTIYKEVRCGYYVCLNNMQAPQIQILTPVARGESRESLIAFLKKEKVEPYTDENWQKTYRKGGPLEWYNPPHISTAECCKSCGDKHFVKIGTLAERKAQFEKYAEEQYKEMLELPKVE
jgi:hypothetical protein